MARKTEIKITPDITKTILNEVFSSELTRSERSKLKIIETAIDSFAGASADLLNYEDIARAGKLNRSLINYYFPKKEEFFEIIIKFIRATHQEIAVAELKKATTPEQVIFYYVDSTFRWIDAAPNHVKSWIMFWYLSSSDPKLRSLHSALTQMGELRIIGILESLPKPKAKLKKSEFSYLAKSIQRVITGALIESMTESEGPTRSRLRHDTWKQCRDLLVANGFLLSQ
jgi:AcrR family transcriptional regulator